MPLSEETRKFQTSLADYCRDNTYREVPGVNSDRAKQYRRLVFNGVKSALNSAYPIAKETLGKERWDEFVTEFFARYPSSSPQLWKMPRGLYEFAVESRYAEMMGLPYLNDLLLFEWIEIEMFMRPDSEIAPYRACQDVLNEHLVLNPDFQVVQLSYPVFKLKGADLLDKRGNYFLLVYRSASTQKVWFSELSPFVVAVLELLKDDPLTGHDVVEAALAFIGSSDETGAKEALQQLVSDEIILGALDE
ncbi:MAG: putative DNA-binding domain-containing protein [Bdellovibrionales bacterium]|nr:putative DNA-binding domain-containing protein [Bdellovibrionales bacterium]